jgi:uncharacterized integral membrane protein
MAMTAVVFVLLAVLFALFAWQNQAPAAITFLSWHHDTSVGWAVLLPLIAGLIIGYGISWGRALQFRLLLRNSEARTKAAEAKLREHERQQEIASDEEA